MMTKNQQWEDYKRRTIERNPALGSSGETKVKVTLAIFWRMMRAAFDLGYTQCATEIEANLDRALRESEEKTIKEGEAILKRADTCMKEISDAISKLFR